MIRGKLVGLRAVEREDLPLLRDWRNVEPFRKRFREFRELNLLHQEKWLERVSSSPNDFMFVIVRLDDMRPVGACGLLYVNWINRSADLSLYIGLDEVYIDDAGFAEEAARVLISYAFDALNLHKVWTELYAFDRQKIALFQDKLGFKRDAILRENCFADGKYHDSHIYSLLHSES